MQYDIATASSWFDFCTIKPTYLHYIAGVNVYTNYTSPQVLLITLPQPYHPPLSMTLSTHLIIISISNYRNTIQVINPGGNNRYIIIIDSIILTISAIYPPWTLYPPPSQRPLCTTPSHHTVYSIGTQNPNQGLLLINPPSTRCHWGWGQGTGWGCCILSLAGYYGNHDLWSRGVYTGVW